MIRAWWDAHPNANVAIATAGLLVLDIDGGANPWPGDAEFLADLADCPVRASTPRGGSHRWYRQPEGRAWSITIGLLAPKVDTRANGGYALVPPSANNGERWPYLWEEGRALDRGPGDLPEPPGWLADALDEIEAGRVRGEPGERRASALLPGALLADGNPIPEGYRNNVLTSLAGSMRRVGMTAPAILAALLAENAGRCVPPLPDREVERIAGSVARYEPDQFATAAAEHHFEQLREGPGGGDPRDPGPIPAHLLTVPGFIAEVMAYTLATSHRPLPAIALAGALALLGTLTGRKVRAEDNARTNVYVLGVAPSGGGKDWPREVNKRILHEAGAEHLIGPEEIKSDAGLVTAMEQHPACLIQYDELGRTLKTFGDPRNAHLYGIATVLMKLYSSAGTLYVAGGYADAKRNRVLHQPHACLFATTVPQSFYEGLTADNVTDGFLSRMLIFEGAFQPKQRKVSCPVPESVLAVARWWALHRAGGNLAGVFPDPEVVPITPAGQAVFDYLDREADRRAVADAAPYGTLWTRATEKAVKLALLYACSRDHEDPVIDEPAALWACELIDFLVLRSCYLVAQWVAENGFDARRKRVLRIITEAGLGGITGTELYRQTRFLTAREREEVLEALKICGDITEHKEPTNGPPRFRYIATTLL